MPARVADRSDFCLLLDGKALAPLVLKIGDCLLDPVNLLPKEPLLPLCRDRNLLELAVADDHGIIIAGCDPGAELLAVCRLEILPAGYKELLSR